MFDKLNGTCIPVPGLQRSESLNLHFFFLPGTVNNIIILVSLPVAGYNHYDDFMLGALIHNINLPENKFEFLFTPLYAFGSKELVGLGRVSYSWHPDNHFSRISVGINGAHFNTNKATDSTGRLLFEYFSKLVPYIRFDFKQSNPEVPSADGWILKPT